MKPIVWLIIVLVLLVGGYFAFAGRDSNNATESPATTDEAGTNETLINETPTETESNAEVKEQTVAYTDSGFSPTSLAVPRGTKVTFRNNSRKQMWVASDPHPVHTNLASFDSRQGIAPGSSYSYIFNETGTWGYHNHLDSGDEGTVVVR